MGKVRAAYDDSVEALTVRDVDAAVVALGATLADAIDDSAEMSGEARTKALYLTPHLMNVLKELLATPASRQAVGAVAKGAKTSGTLGKLQGITGGKTA